jgi:4'-phosphopantetheinyl transferase
MPIVRQWTVFEDCSILIWEIAEPIDELQEGLVANADEWEEYYTISHPQKQLEWLSGRRAMQTLVENEGLKYEGMIKDEYGKPFLKNRLAEISLTHTAYYIVVAQHPFRAIGVDLERVAPKLSRVAPKFLSEEESQHAQNDLTRLCTYWCAKEAIYKLHGTRQLSFKDEIPIQAFADDASFLTGTIQHLNNGISQVYRLHRFQIADFLGVFAI